MSSWTVVYERSATGWSAYVPALPGVGVAGATHEDVEDLVVEAIALHLEGLVADGLPIPEPGTVPLCGNSIGTDRRFLAAQLPAVEQWLHYRSVDVSTVKELCRRWYPDALRRAPAKQTAHRALDDIRESVAELAYYRRAIFAPTGGAASTGPTDAGIAASAGGKPA